MTDPSFFSTMEEDLKSSGAYISVPGYRVTTATGVAQRQPRTNNSRMTTESPSTPRRLVSRRREASTPLGDCIFPFDSEFPTPNRTNLFDMNLQMGDWSLTLSPAVANFNANSNFIDELKVSPLRQPHIFQPPQPEPASCKRASSKRGEGKPAKRSHREKKGEEKKEQPSNSRTLASRIANVALNSTDASVGPCRVCAGTAKAGKEYCKSCYGVLYKHIKQIIETIHRDGTKFETGGNKIETLSRLEQTIRSTKQRTRRQCHGRPLL